MKESLFEFNERTDREKWKGLSSAYRNGAKCRLLDIVHYNYTFRKDFEEAWHRGWNTMDQYLKEGNDVCVETKEEADLRRLSRGRQYSEEDLKAKLRSQQKAKPKSKKE